MNSNFSPEYLLKNSNEEPLSRRLYLDLIKKCLTRSILKSHYEFVPSTDKGIWPFVQKIFKLGPYRLVRPLNTAIERGMGWPIEGETMIGMKRLDHLENCIVQVLDQKIPGDFIETGVWRGGATIFMRAALKVYDDFQRIVWVADSFQGLPKPNHRDYPNDFYSKLWTEDCLAISLDEVKENFKKYDLLDEQVKFLPGWFKDTLPQAHIEKLSLLRLDGDMYESTMNGLHYLYPKLSVGGYVIIDDYEALDSCKKAVEDFRKRNEITEEIQHVDASCIFWKRIN